MTVNSERICREVEICRWGGRGGEGVQSTVNSERICREVETCRWGGRGGVGGSINSQLGEGSVKIFEGLPLTMFILGGGGSIDNQLGKEGSAKT